MRIGAYEVISEAGRGGAGAVLRARSMDGRDVAIKILIRPTDEARARFERERRLLSGLTAAEGFVPLVDSGESPQGPFIVMPFVSGGSLRDRLHRGALPIGDTVELALRLTEALGRAHERGLVHRDLKPENILFDGEGRPLVADLGLAKHFSREAPGASRSISLTADGTFHGTAGYMAPEQIDSAREAGPPADVFALGAILYECLAGQPAFDGESIHEVLAKVASGSFVAVRALNRAVPRWLARLIAVALNPDPSRRWKDGRAFNLALRDGPRAEKKLRALQLAVGGLSIFLLAMIALVLGAPRAGSPSPPPPPEPAPVATQGETVRPRSEIPAWWVALDKDERPALPLPKGIAFAKAAGEYMNAADGSVLVFVPRGSFRFGKSEKLVNLSPYFIGKLELTVAQFRKFADAKKHLTDAEKSGGGQIVDGRTTGHTEVDGTAATGVSWKRPNPAKPDARDDEPVAQVSWDDARAYCAWAGLALPTEMQWERAAGWDRREQKPRPYPWGHEVPGASLAKRANLADISFRLALPGSKEIFEGYDDGFPGVAPVGSFPQGASPCGALDMLGNVLEWCEDGWTDAVETTFKDGTWDPVRSPEGSVERIARGGSFGSSPGQDYVTYRSNYPAHLAAEDLGFRVARPAR